MSEVNSDWITISTENEEVYAKCWVVNDTASADAQCYLNGPGHGDEIFGLVQDTLQQTANKNNLPIRHIFTSSNKGALALVQRTENYKQTGVDENGNILFEHVYTPQSQ